MIIPLLHGLSECRHDLRICDHVIDSDHTLDIEHLHGIAFNELFQPRPCWVLRPAAAID